MALKSFDPAHFDDDGYILVTGCPRSATRYTAETFQAAGLDVLHESRGKEGISAFHIVPWLPLVRKSTILHVVREPLACIASMQTMNNRSWNYVRKFVGIHPDYDGLFRARMRLWQVWNGMAMALADLTFRAEDDTAWGRICGLLEIDHPRPDVSRETNSRIGHYKPLKWRDLKEEDKTLCHCIKGLAEVYGYEVGN